MTSIFIPTECDAAAAVRVAPMQLSLIGEGPEMLGVLTDVLRTPGQFARTAAGRHLAHISAVQKCLADDRLTTWTGLAPSDIKVVSDEVSPTDYGRSAVLVDGRPVEVDTLTYRSLSFAFGGDVERYPFTLVRPAGLQKSWPELRRAHT